MKYKLNFSHLQAQLLREGKISFREITEVFEGDSDHTVWGALPRYSQSRVSYYLIGFSFRKRFLQIVLSCDGDEIHFLDVKVAGLEEISQHFFKAKMR